MKSAAKNRSYKSAVRTDSKRHVGENNFRALADNMSNLAWMADPDGWIYWYNARWYEYTGTSNEDMEGWGWQSVHNPKDLPHVMKRWQASIRTGKPFEMVFPLKGADGVFRPFLTRVLPIKDEDGEILQWFGTNTDITEQKQAHSELKQAKIEVENEKQRLHDLFMQVPAMMAVCRGPDLRFELANPLYLKAVGKTPDIIGKAVLEVFPELVGQGLLEILFTVYKTGEPFTGNEVPVKLDIHNNGQPEEVYFTFIYQPIRDSKDKVSGIMTHAVNVTEHVKARKTAEESEARFRFMAESLPQKIFTASPDGKITYFNPQWAEYTGLSLKKLEKGGVQQFVHPDDLPENMRLWRQALTTGEPLENEQRLRRGDGQYRKHISHVRAMRDSDGKIIRWFGSMTDIEDVTQTIAREKELEHKTAVLQEQRAELIAINTAKDDFISLASHQLRTPATSVKQYIGMLLEGYAGDVTDAQKDFLQRAYNGNERQINIVNDLLKVALVDAGRVKLRLEKVDLSPLISEIIAGQADKFASRKQNVQFESSKVKCPVIADGELTRMVMENLIDNACKYTYEGKNITIKLQKSKGNADIIIQDEGVGIPKDKLNKLFQKFSRLDNPLSIAAGGTGLGLYWVKQIIELHKGKISVVSKVGKGTTFTVSLPTNTL